MRMSTERAKACGLSKTRHDLCCKSRTPPKHYAELLSARDVEHDSGRSNSAKPYQGGVSVLLAANFKRCEEALRVLEEYGRVMSPKAVKNAQALRFKVYQWETK